MKVLVVGNGGREHAICWKLKQSPLVEKVYCAPGNAGISAVAELVNIQVSDLGALADFAEKNKIELTVAGPEAPLCDGIVDVFRKRNLRIFGPAKAAAELEGSKEFAKSFMQKYSIPTADAESFTEQNPALDYIRRQFGSGAKGIVVKADGLAAGKGVTVALKEEEALQAVRECFSGAFGSAGAKVLIEECLFGEEASILALTDGETIIPLASSQDHKRLMDNDEGPNTGGMGAYSPAPVVTESLMAEIKRSVLDNFLRGIKEEKLCFRGVIYAGIMVTEKGPKVLEFNVRFGDPETQAVLMRLKSDLADVMVKTSDAMLDKVNLEWYDDPAICVVMASGGYPANYEKGFEIKGLADAESTGAVVFHAGTSLKDGKIVNTGGRVLGVTAKGKDISEAIKNAYRAVEKISWKKTFYRKDIAFRAFERLK
ncbi:MAG: phosphoribosylamine--glycine ligase [Lentisphaerae bacterium GWF2_45_14]|nr:MAG: phosphoribosylamine--glycine ligase [Lentisphaerae bacterium GWF2_45_14]